jgi:hypothetical protein
MNNPNIQIGKIEFGNNQHPISDNTKIKSLIKEYFSDNLQTDETPMGALKRNQIVKQLMAFANESY